MAATGTMHGTHIAQQYGTTANNRIDWATDTIKIALISNAAAPDPDTHDFWSDLEANEISATGYTAGGLSLSGKSVTLTGASNKVVLDATDPSWTFSTTAAFRYAVIYKDLGGATTADPIIGSIDFGANQSLTGVFTIQVDADGLFKGTY